MDQHPVPQNVTSFEFKIVGFLTLKQFAVMGVFGVLAFISFISNDNWTIKIVSASLLIGAGVLLTFGQINNIPFSRWLMLFVHAIFSPTERIWIKSALAPTYFTNQYAAPVAASNTLSFDNRQVLTSYLQTLPQGQRSTLDMAEEQRIKSLGLGTYSPTTRASTTPPGAKKASAPLPNTPPPSTAAPVTLAPLPQTHPQPIQISHLPSSLSDQKNPTTIIPPNTPNLNFPSQPPSVMPPPSKQPPTSSTPLPTTPNNPPTGYTNPPPSPNPTLTPNAPKPHMNLSANPPTVSAPPTPNAQPVKSAPVLSNVPPKEADHKEEVIQMDPKVVQQALNKAVGNTPPANTYQMIQRLEQEYLEQLQVMEREHQQQLANLNNKLKESQNQNLQLTTQLQTSAQSAQNTNQLTQQNQLLTSELTSLKDQLLQLQKANASLVSEKELTQNNTASPQAQDKQIQELQAQISHDQSTLVEKNHRIAELEQQVTTLTTQNDQAQQKITQLQSELAKQKTEYTTVLTERDSIKQTLASAENEKATLLKEKAELKKQLDEIAKNLETVKKENLTEQEQKINEIKTGLESEIKRLQSELTTAQNNLTTERNKAASLEQLTKENESLKQAKTSLENQVAALNQSQNDLVSQLNVAKAEIKISANQNKILQETAAKSKTPPLPQTQQDFAPHTIDLQHFENLPTKNTSSTPAQPPKNLDIQHDIPQNKAQTLSNNPGEPPQKKSEEDKKIITEYRTAQIPTITNLVNVMSGIVYDKKSNILPNAIIIVKDADKSPVRALKSNRLGQFAISTPLPNGVYTIEVEDNKEESEFDIYQVTLNGSVLPPIEIKAKTS